MPSPENNTDNQQLPHSEDLHQFYKEFTAFNETYAFFCDALAMMGDEQKRDPNTIAGMQRCSRWLKQRMDDLRVQLERIQQQSTQ